MNIWKICGSHSGVTWDARSYLGGGSALLWQGTCASC